MMRSARLALLLFLCAASASAEDGARVMIGSLAAASEGASADPDFRGSPIAQVAAALMKQLKYQRPAEIVPFARAVEEAKERDDTVILPLARTPEREASYRWLVPLWEDECVMISFPSSSKKSAGIGVVRGSAAQEIAESLGYAGIELSRDDVQNVRKLTHGHIGSWFTSKRRAENAIHFVGLRVQDFAFSSPIQKMAIYIAASVKLDPKEVEKWRAAGVALRDNGTLEAILGESPDQLTELQ